MIICTCIIFLWYECHLELTHTNMYRAKKDTRHFGRCSVSFVMRCLEISIFRESNKSTHTRLHNLYCSIKLKVSRDGYHKIQPTTVMTRSCSVLNLIDSEKCNRWANQNQLESYAFDILYAAAPQLWCMLHTLASVCALWFFKLIPTWIINFHFLLIKRGHIAFLLHFPFVWVCVCVCWLRWSVHANVYFVHPHRNDTAHWIDDMISDMLPLIWTKSDRKNGIYEHFHCNGHTGVLNKKRRKKKNGKYNYFNGIDAHRTRYLKSNTMRK